MPDPLKFKKEAWISSKTGRGNAAGPALKLWIRFSVIPFLLVKSLLDFTKVPQLMLRYGYQTGAGMPFLHADVGRHPVLFIECAPGSQPPLE